MIQQRVQVCLLLVLFAVSTIAMGSNFPDILVQKDGSEVRGTLLEKKADGSGTFQKFNGELLEFRADKVSYVGPATRPNAEPTQAQQEMGTKPSIKRPIPIVSTNIPGVVMYEPENRQAGGAVAIGSRGLRGSFRATGELPKKLRLTRHLPIGSPRDGARIPKSTRRARRSRWAY